MHSIIAFHGFLGSPKDFFPLRIDRLLGVDLFRISAGPMNAWAKRFNRTCPDGSILLGYSMGGRLALHCLLNQPNKFSAAIIVSAHPGIESLVLRRRRLVNDFLWARKFQIMPWEKLMAEWNDLPALKSSLPINRREENFFRAELAHYMRYFSLGQQDYLTPRINELDLPILWLVHENESGVIRDLQLKNALSQLVLIRKGGHRFMFEYPQLLSKRINEFLYHLY